MTEHSLQDDVVWITGLLEHYWPEQESEIRALTPFLFRAVGRMGYDGVSHIAGRVATLTCAQWAEAPLA